MRRLAFILVLLSTACFGQQVFRVQKFCEVGGQKVITQGLNSVTNIQRSFPKCTVTVYLTGTTTIAAVYSDNLGPPTPLANPFTANVDGSWGFYASTASCYDVVTSGGNPGDTFPQPFTYSNICVGGGGGTGVNPGTPYQVTRYDPTGVNIQDSTGSDNPANGPTRWTQGLSVEGNAGYRMFVNSSAGTTTNLLVCRDASVTSITEVTTCPVSSNSVFGLADNGSGVTGNVRVAMIGFHPCVFDGQTVVGDWAVPSATNAGQCSDGGATKPTTQQVLGHITTLNTGAATLATVDLWTGDTISGGGATVAVAPCTITGCFAYYTTPNSIGGDNHTNLDGSGNGQLASLGLTDLTHSGFWYQQAGPALPSLTGLNRFYFAVNTAFGTTYGLEPWDNAPTVGHCVDIATGDAAGWVKLHDAGASCGAGITFQTNTVNNASQTTLNLIASTNITLTNTSGGNVTIAASGAAAPQASNPTAPTLTTNGSAGSTSYSYKVVGCEDGTTCAYHSAVTSASTIATGNATLTSSNSINLKTYGDTLYGYRCYNIYRTATAGTPNTTGLIASCVGKTFIDTGLAGDSTTAPSTNTTVLDANGLTNPLPGCNKIPATPYGVDGMPCSPNIFDDEMAESFGAPADVNDPFWTWVNQGSATAAWTGGTMFLTLDAGSGGNGLVRGLAQTLPAPPFTFIIYVDGMLQQPFNHCGLMLRESGTAKATSIAFQQRQAFNGGAGGGIELASFNWSANNAGSEHLFLFNQGPLGYYLQIQDDATNIKVSWSVDGIKYRQLDSQTIASLYTSAPNQLVLYGSAYSATAGDMCVFDYERRTQ